MLTAPAVDLEQPNATSKNTSQTAHAAIDIAKPPESYCSNAGVTWLFNKAKQANAQIERALGRKLSFDDFLSTLLLAFNALKAQYSTSTEKWDSEFAEFGISVFINGITAIVDYRNFNDKNAELDELQLELIKVLQARPDLMTEFAFNKAMGAGVCTNPQDCNYGCIKKLEENWNNCRELRVKLQDTKIADGKLQGYEFTLYNLQNRYALVNNTANRLSWLALLATITFGLYKLGVAPANQDTNKDCDDNSESQVSALYATIDSGITAFSGIPFRGIADWVIALCLRQQSTIRTAVKHVASYIQQQTKAELDSDREMLHIPRALVDILDKTEKSLDPDLEHNISELRGQIIEHNKEHKKKVYKQEGYKQGIEEVTKDLMELQKSDDGNATPILHQLRERIARLPEPRFVDLTDPHDPLAMQMRALAARDYATRPLLNPQKP